MSQLDLKVLYLSMGLSFVVVGLMIFILDNWSL